jgi:hypothetical protein
MKLAKNIFELLDTTHKTSVVLLYPDRYDIKDNVEYFRQLLELRQLEYYRRRY